MSIEDWNDPEASRSERLSFFREALGLDSYDYSVPVLEQTPRVDGLSDSEQEQLEKLWGKLRKCAPRNSLLNVYYDGHRGLQSFGISVPEELRAVRASLGWPAKAVQMLARKHVFEGYAIAGESDPYGLGEVLTRNRFAFELAQGINAAYKHGVAFLTVAGDENGGVRIAARDANWATALWDETRREVDAALTVEGTDKERRPTLFTLWLADKIVTCVKDGLAWSSTHVEHRLGRVPVEPLVNDPQLGRPFGHSRITREVRYLTDAAVRTMVRAETSAEFFAAPQRYALGMDEGAFGDKSGWEAVVGRLWAIEPNEHGDIPSVGQFPQLSMEPHLSMYRQLAQNFCSATNLPMSAVGLFSDNPASAEAMQAAEYALSDEAEYQWRVFSEPIRRVLEDAVMFRDGLSAPPEDSWSIAVRWTPARYVSPQAASDFIVKVASVFEDVKATDVAKRRAGFTQAEIDEMNAQARRANALDTLERMAGIARAKPADAPVGGEQGEIGAE